MGYQLGLSHWAVIEWKGCRGLQWPGLLPLLLNEHAAPRPQVLLIHLGGNNLGLIKGKAQVLQVIEDLQVIRAQ